MSIFNPNIDDINDEPNRDFLSLDESGPADCIPDQIYAGESSDNEMVDEDAEEKQAKSTMDDELITLNKKVSPGKGNHSGYGITRGCLEKKQKEQKIMVHQRTSNFLQRPMPTSKRNLQIQIQGINEKAQTNGHRFDLIMNQNMKQRKNPNFTKFLVSAFHREVQRLKSEGEIGEQLEQFLTESKEIYEVRGKRMIKMQTLDILFGKEIEGTSFRSENRRILHRLLGEPNFKAYAITNPFAKAHNIKQHLLASKVYRLRTFSSGLTGRTQTK